MCATFGAVNIFLNPISYHSLYGGCVDADLYPCDRAAECIHDVTGLYFNISLAFVSSSKHFVNTDPTIIVDRLPLPFF